ncbi:MAG TPA: hypothetical protein ENF50_01080 [Archaeoglobus veneficus]|nr:hypothetical protein [Archaeoglobus veneficus]
MENKNNKQTREKLQEWLDNIPEIAREKESTNVLAFVFFVEVLKGKRRSKRQCLTLQRIQGC